MSAPSEYGLIVDPETAKQQIIAIPETVCYSALNRKIRQIVEYCESLTAPEPRKGIDYSGNEPGGEELCSGRGEYFLIGKLKDNPKIELTLRGGSVSAFSTDSGLIEFRPIFRVCLQSEGKDVEFQPDRSREGFPLLKKDYGAEIALKMSENSLADFWMVARDQNLEATAIKLYQQIAFLSRKR